MTTTQRVINFSGGKTSAYMAITEYKPGDIVIFCDTGREHPKTYKFINDFEAFEKIPVIRLAYTGGFEKMIEREGYKTVPNRVMRYCTKHLKIITARKYLLSIGVTHCENFIGFRADEQRRVLKSKPRWVNYKQKFPLYDNGITNADINEYWRNKPYTLEIPRILGNCDLCFMKGKNAIISILIQYPELADKWINDEKRNGGTYFNGVSYEQLRRIAQNNLFKDYNLNVVQPAFDCSCHA
jgi:hypothetical protein